MTWFMVDVEADGPCPGLYSMIKIGVVKVEDIPSPSIFYGELQPLKGTQWQQEALNVVNVTREDTLNYCLPEVTMRDLDDWIRRNSNGRPLFISDNNGFDWQFVNFYFHFFLGYNPFGHSSTNLGSLYKGLTGDFFTSFKHLRRTFHDHNPVNDAIGNVEALLYMKKEMGLKINLE